MLLPRTLRFCQWFMHCAEERVPTSCDTATHEMLSEEASPDVVGVACAKLLSTAFSNSACSASNHSPACRASAQLYTQSSATLAKANLVVRRGGYNSVSELFS